MTSTSLDWYPRANFKSWKEWLIYFVFNDPDFIKRVERVENNEKDEELKKDKFEVLAEFYWITYEDIDRYFLTKRLYQTNDTPNIKTSFNPKTGVVNIEFGILTPNAEIKDALAKIAIIKKEVFEVKDGRRKPPKDPELIYAVACARRGRSENQQLTFSQIFNKLAQRQLPKYTKNYNLEHPNHLVARDLEDYYYKNKYTRK